MSSPARGRSAYWTEQWEAGNEIMTKRSSSHSIRHITELVKRWSDRRLIFLAYSVKTSYRPSELRPKGSMSRCYGSLLLARYTGLQTPEQSKGPREARWFWKEWYAPGEEAGFQGNSSAAAQGRGRLVHRGSEEQWFSSFK